MQQMTWDISLQQIQIFLAAVELRNFTQVAHRFNYTQSMVSKTISAMEEELELTLFVRKPHELAPTKAALFLSQEWRQLVGSFNHTVERARACQESQKQKINIGFIDSSARVDTLISRSVREWSAENPNVQLCMEKHDMHRAAELLNVGMLDLILTSGMEALWLEEHDLPWEMLCQTNVAVFVPRTNPLFERDSLSFDDLRGQKQLTLNSLMNPTYTTWLKDLEMRHGFQTEIAGTFRTVRSLLFNLKMGDSIFIGDAITADWCDEELKMFLLPEKFYSLVAWRSENESVINLKNYLRKAYSKLY